MADILNQDEVDLLVKILKIAEPIYSDEDIEYFKYSSSVRSVFYSLVGKLEKRCGIDRPLL